MNSKLFYLLLYIKNQIHVQFILTTQPCTIALRHTTPIFSQLDFESSLMKINSSVVAVALIGRQGVVRMVWVSIVILKAYF